MTSDKLAKLDENELSELIVNAAIEVHRGLGGPGPLLWNREDHNAKTQSRKGAKDIS